MVHLSGVTDTLLLLAQASATTAHFDAGAWILEHGATVLGFLALLLQGYRSWLRIDENRGHIATLRQGFDRLMAALYGSDAKLGDIPSIRFELRQQSAALEEGALAHRTLMERYEQLSSELSQVQRTCAINHARG